VPAAAALVAWHLDPATNPQLHFATLETSALNQRQDAGRRSRLTTCDERLADLGVMGIGL
jgi:hypothetical protein